jgi:beta-xylosidase
MLWLLLCTAASSQQPVIPGDFADPTVIKVGNTYYAAGTSSEWAPHYPIFISKDMLSWKQAGYIFQKKPEWTSSSFWAPELFYYRNTFYVYYTARRKSDNVSYIGVATSKDPLKGFTDHGLLVEFGKEAIDAFVINDNGQLYITFKAYGLDKRPIEILGSKLSADGLKMEGETFSLLRDDARAGLEGQVLIKKDKYYYLFYSAGNCCGLQCSYNIRVARAENIRGPYENYPENPILSDNENWKCPGHGTIVQPTPGEYLYLYHAYNKKDNVFTGRQAILNELAWNGSTGWPYFKNNRPSSLSLSGQNIRDDFNTPGLPMHWQWDFRHSEPKASIRDGNLLLSGVRDTANHAGTAITVRPVSGNYELRTGLVKPNGSVGGLVIYGDANQAVGIGASANKIEVWEVKKNQRRILAESEYGTSKLQLRMTVREGYQCRFFFSTDGNSWKELKIPDLQFYDGRSLPPWDRSPRVGIIHYGKEDIPAVFSFFEIAYQ